MGYNFLEILSSRPLEELLPIPMEEYFFQYEERTFTLIENIKENFLRKMLYGMLNKDA